MNLTPLAQAASTSQPVAKRAVPTSRPGSRAGKKPKNAASRPTKTSKKKKMVVCRGRLKYGKYCLGRIVGPSFVQKIIRCPHDGKAMRVKSLRKPWVAKTFDSDLRPHSGHYRQIDRLWVCPQSGYAAYPKDFFKPYPKKRMEHALRRIRRTFRSAKEIPLAYRYRAAQASYWARKRPSTFFVELYIKAMWAGREQKKPKFALKMRRNAIFGLRFALKKGLYKDPKVKLKMTYLLAELYRQQGKFGVALRYLEKALKVLAGIYKKTPKGMARAQYRWIERAILSCQVKVSVKKKGVYVLDVGAY